MSDESPQSENENQAPDKATDKPVENQPAPEVQHASSSEEAPKPAKKEGAKKSAKNVKKAAKKKGAEVANDKEQDASDNSKPAKKKSAANQQGNNGQDEHNSPEGARKQGRNRRSRGGRGNNRPDAPEEPKVKLDTKLVAKRAWKIFVGEVNEEGLALIADKDARELARRSLRVAEIYSREEAVQLAKAKQESKKKKVSKNAEVKDEKLDQQPKSPDKPAVAADQPETA